MLDRRNFLAGAAALPFTFKRATSKQVGSATLTTVSDGTLVLPREFVFGPMPTDALRAVLEPFDLDQDVLEPECNLALFEDEDRRILFDAGSGPDFMPSAGNLLASLENIGIAPETVTHVLFTHAHPDHIWGVLDDFDDPTFPNAVPMMGRAEWDYWWNPETVETIGDARAAFAVGARRRMEAIEDSVVLFDPDTEVLPGISAIASHGHTPGHMSFEIRSGSDSALVVGDAIGNHHVAFARPDWPSGSDQNMDQAVLSRKMLLDRLANESMTCVGFHLPGGGVGRVERDADSYRFVGEDA